MPGRPSDKQRLGQAGEAAALDHLLRQGLTLVRRNFRCKGGEIDLIMRHGAELVFVEVRQRGGASHGGAAASVTPAKQRRLALAAHVYLQALAATPPCRFDVVAIDSGRLSWLPNAIEV